jgi:dsDNA-binding SOS-regulon protein
MKGFSLDYDQESGTSEVSQNTDLKVFQAPHRLNQERNSVKKMSTEPKFDSTQHSTLRSDGDKKDSLSIFLKEEKTVRKKILNQKLDSKLELQNVIIDEEIESYSIKSDKIEEFPLSFRPTGLAYKESNKDSLNE